MKPANIKTLQWIKFNSLLVLEHFLGRNLFKKKISALRVGLYQEILKNKDIKQRAEVFTNKDVICEDLNKILQKKELLSQGPLLFKGAAKEWDCTKKWSKDYFSKHFYNHKVSLVGNVGLVNEEHVNNPENTDLKSFINKMNKSKANYLRFARFIDEDPNLRKDINVGWLEKFKSKFSRGGYLYLFMGEDKSSTDMHNAIIQSLFIQVKGQKKWTLYNPNERIFLNTIADRRPYFYTGANPNILDDANYPLLKYAKKYEIVLDEGDVLWFPTFYWHYVENIGENIGITYKFTEFGEAFKASKTLSFLFFLATKPTIIQSLYYNVVKKRDLLFDKSH